MFSVFLFMIIASVIVWAGIKLSDYANSLNEQTSLDSLMIGGVLLAITTSLPEFFTVLSALVIKNYSLAIGDVLGGNLFNIFMLSIFDIVLIKELIFKKVDQVFFSLTGILLFINVSYLVLSFLPVHAATLPILIVIAYIIYLKTIGQVSQVDEYLSSRVVPYLKTKFFLLSVLLIGLSIAMTLTADNIIHTYHFLTASTVGAYLLGVSTSLPEIVISYNLLKMKNYNLAMAGIYGSNFLNILLLGGLDLVFPVSLLSGPLHIKTHQLIVFGSILYILMLLKKDSKSYLIWSILIVIAYLILFYLQFIV